MAINLPDRNYLTFPELQDRWGCEQRDIIYAVITGELKPCIKLPASVVLQFWDVDGYDDEEGREIRDVPGKTCTCDRPYGWFFIQDPVQTHPFDFEFKFAASERDASKSDDDFFSPFWYCLPFPRNSEWVISNGVFFLTEIAEYESKYASDSAEQRAPAKSNATHEKPLSSKEHTSYLTIIAALCKVADYDFLKASKTAGLIKNQADLSGWNISESNIEGKLKLIPGALEVRMK